jgi:hypothetical protein
MPLPDAILNKPKMAPGLEFIWRAFWEMSTDRDFGMAEGPIPWSVMDRYALRHEIEDDEFDRFVLMIKSLDSVYIEHRTKQQNKKMKKGSKSAIKSGSDNKSIRRGSL